MKQQLNVEEFAKTELGSAMIACAIAWDRSLHEINFLGYKTNSTIFYEHSDYHKELIHKYNKANRLAEKCLAQWEVYQLAVSQFYGVELHFTRTDDYMGICTEDEKTWLFREFRKEKSKSEEMSVMPQVHRSR